MTLRFEHLRGVGEAPRDDVAGGQQFVAPCEDGTIGRGTAGPVACGAQRRLDGSRRDR